MKKGMSEILVLTEEDKRKAQRAAKRLAEIECGARTATHRVHKNKKAYDRQRDKKVDY